MIPKTYPQWFDCITRECGITLTGDFIRERLSVLENDAHQETRRFIACYGRPHLRNIIQWYRRAAAEIGAGQRA